MLWQLQCPIVYLDVVREWVVVRMKRHSIHRCSKRFNIGASDQLVRSNSKSAKAKMISRCIDANRLSIQESRAARLLHHLPAVAAAQKSSVIAHPLGIQLNSSSRGQMQPSATAAAGSTSATDIATSAARLTFMCMPRIGLGLAALGRPGYINLGHDGDLSSKDVDAMREHCWKVLDEAWACGVRYFDCARSYGLAEEFLGAWLRERRIAPGAVVVGSKWGYYYTADWQIDTQGQPHEVKEHTATNLAKQAAETAANLGEYLDLYQIHSATLESGVLGAQDVLALLAELKSDRGWAMGLSVSGDQQGRVIQQALQVTTPDGQRLFSSVQATWNLLEQSAGADLLAAHQAGLSVIVKEAMANGRLTSRNGNPDFKCKLALLQDVANQYDTTVDALSLACVLKQPFRPMVLSGACTVEHLHSNFAAVEMADELPDEVVQQLQQQMAQTPQQYWQERSQLSWN